MPKSRPAYPAAFREQVLELVRAGQTHGELARELEPTARTIHNWVAQSERDRGTRTDGLTTDGLTTAERQELMPLQAVESALQGRLRKSYVLT